MEEKRLKSPKVIVARDPEMMDVFSSKRNVPRLIKMNPRASKATDPSFYSATTNIPHIRCYSCNKVIGHLDEPYNEMLSGGMNPEDIFEKLGVSRVCCRLRIANPPVVATAEYIEKSDISPVSVEPTIDPEQRKLEEDILKEAEAVVEMKKKEAEAVLEMEKNKQKKIQSSVASIKARVLGLNAEKPEKKVEKGAKKPEQRRITTYKAI
jgi:DNA-directed RNA polymerase subunit N (RpoN/RPB10)